MGSYGAESKFTIPWLFDDADHTLHKTSGLPPGTLRLMIPSCLRLARAQDALLHPPGMSLEIKYSKIRLAETPNDALTTNIRYGALKYF
jgi:hypothetical protein